MLQNRTYLKIVTWPVFLLTTAFFALCPHWAENFRAWAQAPPVWPNEATIPIEWSDKYVAPPAADGDPVRGRGIAEKAAELGNHPVLIFEFVRNQIEYDPYSGSRFGAVGTLERGRGNDVDQAFLLAALLRAAYRASNKAEPKLWIVRGDVSIEGSRALAWLGVADGNVLTRRLAAAGVRHEILGNPASTDFSLTLRDHVWVRGDLEFGPYRGARFVEGEDGILADLDPSFVPQEAVGDLPEPFELTGIDSATFVQQVEAAAAADAAQGAASGLPEGFMRSQTDSGAAVLRRLTETQGLSLAQVIEKRRPTVEQIDALPDALPFTPLQSPQTYDTLDPDEREELLSLVRHRVQVRLTAAQPGAEPLADVVFNASELYGRSLTAGFEADAPPTEQTLASASLAAGALSVIARVRLDGAARNDPPGPSLPYGNAARLELALSHGGFDAGAERPDPFDDPAAEKSSYDTWAGSLFAVAAVPGLNPGSRGTYYNRALSQTTQLAGPIGSIEDDGITAADALGPSLDLAAQVVLGQIEDFFRLGASAAGHRAAPTGETVIVGMEPVREPLAPQFAAPRFVIAARSGAPALDRAAELDSPLFLQTAALANLLQLTRDALLVHGLRTALPGGTNPLSAGRILRDANSADPSLPTYAVLQSNSNALSASSDRVPALDDPIRRNLLAAADQGGLALMPSASVLTATPAPPSSLGTGWGYVLRDPQNRWNSSARAASGGRFSSAFSEQTNAEALTPAALVFGASAAPYHRLAEQSIGGVEAWEGMAKATLEAFVAGVHPVGALLASADPQDPADTAVDAGSAVVWLHAMLEEAARPRALGLKLELASEPSSQVLAPGGVFNPAYHTRVTARAEFSQIMDQVVFRAYNGANVEIGNFTLEASQSLTPLREAAWDMKGGNAPANLFSDLAEYNGPIVIRVRGTTFGQEAPELAESFVFDTQPPELALAGWDSERLYRGTILVNGTATDLHFDSFDVDAATGENPASDSWFPLVIQNAQDVPGTGLLARWDAAAPPRNGAHSIRLAARDRAGNSGAVSAVVNLRNDGIDPVISITAPAAGSLAGEVPVLVQASDSQPGMDSGLRRFKVWAEYSQADFNAGNPNPFIPATRVLLDESYEAPVPSAAYDAPLDTAQFQSSGLSTLTLRARAEDDFGRAAETSRTYNLANKLFNVTLSNSTLRPASAGIAASPPIRVRIYQGVETPPQVRLLYPDNSDVGPLAVSAPIRRVHSNTWFSEYSWAYTQLTTAPGPYRIRVTLGAEQRMFDVFLVTGAAPVAYIDEPKSTILLKDSAPQVEFTGWIVNPPLAMNDARPASAPIETMFQASRPYWQLAYKPHSAPPLIESNDPASFQFISNIAHESNWKEIAHGFAEVGADSDPAPIAEWDISRIPDGLYDIRLLTTDGSVYVTSVVPGYKVFDSSSLPGDDPLDRTPGALALRQVDLNVPFEGFPVEVARSYNSLRAAEKGDFGWGWRLEGLNLKVVKTVSEIDELGDERLEAEITLPDGRSFTYANEPPNTAELGDYHKNSWAWQRAFFNRPYGQMLWLPGRTNSYQEFLLGTYDEDTTTEGYQKVEDYLSAPPNGEIACLKLEDGSFLLFEWETGKLLERDYNDGERKIAYSSGTSSGGAPQVLVGDNLGRSVTLERNAAGLVSKIIDPLGQEILYGYNAAGELATITDRKGGIRRLYYADPARPHYLTRMVIERGDGETTEIAYDYTDSGRLEEIDTGAGTIGMEYEDTPGGGGRQTVVDEATGGRTEVEYDASGRLLRQIDAAGVVTEYEYFADSGEFDPEAPPGVLSAQTVGGVRTEFEYNLAPYQQQSFGIEGIAQNFVDFWMNRASNGAISNDYNQSGVLKPGYLTSQQLQPATVGTPAIENGANIGVNTVALNYTPSGPLGTMPDGTGKIYAVDDPEGRHIHLGYGASPASKNETALITGPAGTEVNNAYVTSGQFTGRLASSSTERNNEVISAVAYAYALGTVGSFAELAAQLAGLGVPSSLWIEKQTVTTSQDEHTTDTVNYLDALGRTVASVSQGDQWSVNLYDGEGRVIFSKSPGGAVTQNAYDGAGLLLSSSTAESEGPTSVTAHEYDEQGRQIRTLRDGEVVSSTEYETLASGGRRTIQTDENGNRNISATDLAGRQTHEIYEGASGTRRETRYGYDEFGRRNYVRDPHGVETWTEFDEAGRATRTRTLAEGMETAETRGYDRYGRTLWTQSPLQAKASPPVFSTYKYNTSAPASSIARGQLEKVFHEDTDDDAANNSSYSGYYEAYEYDAEGRQTAVTKPVALDESTVVARKDTSVFNDDGQLVQAILNDVQTVTDPNSQNLVFNFQYDEDGNRTQVTYPSGIVRDLSAEEEAAPEPEPTGFIETFNDEGLLTSIGKPEGTIHYAYDRYGELASIGALGRTTGYERDIMNRLSRMIAPEGTWVYGYNEAGLKKRVDNLATGDTDVSEYDALGRLEKRTHARASGEIIFEIDYILGDDGRRMGAVERRGSDVKVWAYKYDGLGRLLRESRDIGDDDVFSDAGDRDVGYAYDKDSNRTALVDYNHATESRTYEYFTGSHRLEKIKDTTGAVVESFTYTAKGEVATRVSSAGTTAYTWSATSTLTEVALPDGRRVRHDYDATGERVRTRVYAADDSLASDEKCLVDLRNPTGYSQVIATLNGANGQVTGFNTFAEEIKCQTGVNGTQSTSQRLHPDGLGSIRALTQAAQSPVPIDFSAYGLSIEEGAGLDAPYAFGGEWMERIISLQHHRARWFDPSIARWISADSYLDFPDGFGLLYGYSGNDPVGHTDPSGRMTLLQAIVAATLAIDVALIAITMVYSIRLIASARANAANIAVISRWKVFLSLYLPEHYQFLLTHQVQFGYNELALLRADANAAYSSEFSALFGEHILLIRGRLHETPDRDSFNRLTHELTHAMLYELGLRDTADHEAIAGAWGKYAGRLYEWHHVLTELEKEGARRENDRIPLPAPPRVSANANAWPANDPEYVY